jgi:Protein of unknown function (DUF1524)
MKASSVSSFGVLLLIGVLSACTGPAPQVGTPTTSRPPNQASASGPSPINSRANRARSRILRLLDRIETTSQAPYHPGYDRSCTGGGACQFGEEWADNHPGAFGRNGCTTREDVLLDQMANVELRRGSTCRIYQASLIDPYSGARLNWHDDGYRIQIDHIYPLAEAWHAGASAWSQSRRLRFANDVRRELLAVSAGVNQDKGSSTPAEWLPPNKRFQCEYVVRYLIVADTYDLTITAADATTIRGVARHC